MVLHLHNSIADIAVITNIEIVVNSRKNVRYAYYTYFKVVILKY